MKVILSCTPFEFIPKAIISALTRTIIRLGNNWGLNIEVAEDSTVGDAEQRFSDWQKAKNALHG